MSARRSNRPRDLVQIAAAIVGSAAAAQVIPARDFPCCDRSGIGDHDSAEHGDTQCNSYETVRPQGFDLDGMTASYTGVNGRRILIREDADGVYVGGVLFGSAAELAEFARLLNAMADY
jgi:hypothetical protein